MLAKMGNGSEYADDQLSIGIHHPELHVSTSTEESINDYWDNYKHNYKHPDISKNEVIGWFIR
jgi:hypothetical protein